MRFVGIDVAAERHVVAVVDETDRVLLKATPFTEDAEGYAKLIGVLGAPTEALVAMEATGHLLEESVRRADRGRLRRGAVEPATDAPSTQPH
jgi:transposase